MSVEQQLPGIALDRLGRNDHRDLVELPFKRKRHPLPSPTKLLLNLLSQRVSTEDLGLSGQGLNYLALYPQASECERSSVRPPGRRIGAPRLTRERCLEDGLKLATDTDLCLAGGPAQRVDASPETPQMYFLIVQFIEKPLHRHDASRGTTQGSRAVQRSRPECLGGASMRPATATRGDPVDAVPPQTANATRRKRT